MRLVGVTAAALVLAGLLGGCGTAYTKGDFIARADAICASTVRETRSIAPPSFANGASRALSAVAQYLARVRPVVESEATQLRSLRRPGGSARDRDALVRYLQAVTQTAADYRRLAQAAERGDAQGVASAEAALRASPVASLAAHVGLRSCATPGATVG